VKKDYSKCPKCNQQIYLYVGDSNAGYYHCYEVTSSLGKGDEVEILAGSRMDRVDFVEDEKFYTCDLALAQGVQENFESSACGELNCKSKLELTWTIDYQSIIRRKEEADAIFAETGEQETSISADWVAKNIHEEMLTNSEFAIWALAKDGLLLEHFSSAIRSSIETVKVAISNSINAYKYLDNCLLRDKENFLELVRNQREILDNVSLNPEWHNDKEFLEELIGVLGWGYSKYIGDDLWNDIEFIKKCIETDGNIICNEKFPKALLNDIKLMSDAIIQASETAPLFLVIPSNVLSDLKFWQIVKKNADGYTWSTLYRYLPNKLKESQDDFVKIDAFSNDAFLFAPKEFKKKSDLIDFIRLQIKEGNSITSDFVIYARCQADSEIDSLLDSAFEKELCENPWDDGDALNLFAWTIAENVDYCFDVDHELKIASICCIRSIEIKECHEVLDTYAHVLFAQGNFKEALVNEEKAVLLAQQINEDESGYVSFIKEIQDRIMLFNKG
jgi:hypothetical protein